MMEKFESKDRNELVDVAERLFELQSFENDGRGVNCVRSIVQYLKLGMIDDARAICMNDGDKIKRYPQIEDIISEKLFNGERYPYTEWHLNKLKE